MFGGGGGGMDPRKLQQMFQQMGIDIAELDAEEVVIRTGEEDLVFSDAEVQRMDAQGQATYTITGDPESREPGSTEGGESGAVESGSDDEPIELGSGDGEDASETSGAGDEITQADVEIVAQRTGASEDDAREALKATDGDLAGAVSRLE